MSNQTFLPIIDQRSKKILGLYAIARTNFAGTETTFALGDGPVNIGLWSRVPTINNDHASSGAFMAAFPTHDEIRQNWHTGHAEFIPVKDVMPATQWVVSPTVIGLREWDGVILRGLKYTLDQGVTLVPVIPGPTVVTPATATWDATMPFGGVPRFAFKEFNWVATFQAQFPTAEPSYIVPTLQPAGDTLKAVIVANSQPVLNQVAYNTIRIVNVSAVPIVPGVFAFGFDIYDRHNNVTSVVFNLTVD